MPAGPVAVTKRQNFRTDTRTSPGLARPGTRTMAAVLKAAVIDSGRVQSEFSIVANCRLGTYRSADI